MAIDNSILRNITGPGGREFLTAKEEVKDAYSRGGLPSAIGMGLRKTPGVLAATVRDTITPEPLRRGLKTLAKGTGEVGKTALTGDITSRATETFPNKTMSNKFSGMVDRIASDRSEQIIPKSTGLREMTKDQRAVASLKDFDKDLAVSGTPRQVGGYEVSGMTSDELERFSRTPTRPGTRMLRTGRPEGGWSPDYSRQPAEEQMPVFKAPGFTGEAKAARINSQKQQWLKERRGAGDAMNLVKTQQEGQTARTLMDMGTAQEKNRILEESNLRQERRLGRPQQVKPDAKVIKVPDGSGGLKDEIRTYDAATGTYVRAMGDQQSLKTIPKNKSDLVSGESYTLPDGRIGMWDGENFSL